MYFRGTTILGKKIYSDKFEGRSLDCVLHDEETGGLYRIDYNNLEVSFDRGNEWFKYNEIKK